MSIKCEKCKRYVEPQFEMDGDIDNYVCPECGSPLYANTAGIHVRGKDM
jgi:DNA-directed RNA polymerase subunit RPC12/RpoP